MHDPPEQVWPAAQVRQAAPPLPQAVVEVPAAQTVPLQQPFGQLVALQLALPAQAPSLQLVPCVQTVPQAPQLFGSIGAFLQFPAQQIQVAGQARLQPPQFAASP